MSLSASTYISPQPVNSSLLRAMTLCTHDKTLSWDNKSQMPEEVLQDQTLILSHIFLLIFSFRLELLVRRKQK